MRKRLHFSRQFGLNSRSDWWFYRFFFKLAAIGAVLELGTAHNQFCCSPLADLRGFPSVLFLYYRPQRSWFKVMFLQASVTGGFYLSACWDTTPPRPPPSAEHAGRYGQRAGGTHPTGMQSCYVFQMDHRLKLEWYYCKEPVQNLKFVTVIPIWFQFQMEMLFKIHPDYSNFEWLSLPTTKFVTVKTFVPFQTAFWPVFMVKLFEISHFLTKFVMGNNHLFHFKQHFGMFLNVNHSKSNVVGFWTPIAELLVEQLW